MKVGFSLGRCIRDIVNGLVDIDDIVVVIAGTKIKTQEHLAEVIDDYLRRADCLKGLDGEECQGVASVLWTEGKIHQSRENGHRARHITESSVWADLMPTGGFEDPMVKEAWTQYRSLLCLTTGVSDKEEINNNWKL